LRIVEILYQLLVMPATSVIVPLIAKIRETPLRLESAILGATQLVTMVAVPVYIALAITAPIAIPMIFGEKWTDSVPLLRLLCIYGVIASCGLIWQSILGGLGRPDVALKTTMVAAVTSVTVLLLGARWGLTAAAAAFVFRGYITFPFMPLVLAKLTGIPAARQYRVFVPVAAATTVMAGAISALMAALDGRLPPPLLLATVLVAGAAAYAATLLLVARTALQKGLAMLGHIHPRQSPA
jgi:PST family polysaccharide transporter